MIANFAKANGTRPPIFDLNLARQASDQAENLAQAQMRKIDRLEEHHRTGSGDDSDTVFAAESNCGFRDAGAQ